MIEIERKFLVTSTAYRAQASTKIQITQGYLNTDKERTVRVRLKGNIGFITVKGKSSNNGLSRFEWEKQLSKTDAEQLLKLCKPTIIDKIRYEIKIGAYIYEVDEFLAENNGLTIAEVELFNENDIIEKPNWLGQEVSGQLKYYNSQLSKYPFKLW